MLTRRKFLALTGAGAATVLMSGCSAHNLPLRDGHFQEHAYQHFPALGLATSVTDEYSFEADVRGTIPRELNGTLYRNGPGLYERAGYRKRCILDGDGMIQAFRIIDGRVRFQNKFVRTEKYVHESRVGKFVYATWSTQAPGGVLNNLLGGKVKSQAGVTAIVQNDRLYAFDDFDIPYELDPNTLETKGPSDLGLPRKSTVCFAHSKIDPKTGEWFLFGLEYGARVVLHITILDKRGRLIRHQTCKLPRKTYMHDFFVSARHIIFNLSSTEINFFDYLTGQKSFLGTFSWKPEIGNIVLVFDRQAEKDPIQYETESCWMWHTLNAYEMGNEIIADFVGYRNPDHIIGQDPALFAIMAGRKGQYRYPGEIRRYVINTAAKNIRSEILDDAGYDFPVINLAHMCHRYRFGYFAQKRNEEIFFNGIARVDMKTLKTESYDFGKESFCSEPVFVPKPAYLCTPDDEPGWLLTEVYDSAKLKTCLAIFEANHVSAGPIAQANLLHIMPLGFHGFWHMQQ